MAKKEMYICDGTGCGTVLLHPEDGYTIKGQICTGVTGTEQTIIVTSTEEAPELVLCGECLAEKLGFKTAGKP